MPFTAAVVGVLLVVGLLTGALWTSARNQPWYPDVAYGVPSFAAGRWWTVVTGPFLAIAPWAYPPMVGTFAAFVGWCEWRLGTRTAVAVAVLAQAGAVLAAAGVLAAGSAAGWAWAERTAQDSDAGFSAASMAALGVVLATVHPPWRLRLRAALALYVTGALVFSATIADLEHFLAATGGLVAGAVLRERLGGPPPAPVRDRVLLLAGTAVLACVAGLVFGAVAPTLGPVGDTGAAVVPAVVAVLVVAPLLAGVYRRAG